tara:strand:- start:2970 stop:3380 length:411 start_codon:yes stop_codon:yes gene_type:complete
MKLHNKLFDPNQTNYPTSKIADTFPFELSDGLHHTWIFDVDGTIVQVQQPPYSQDILLPGVKEMWSKIPQNDMIIIMTARSWSVQTQTLQFLDDNGLRYDSAIFGVPHGERIVVNDNKPGGLLTAISWNVKRNKGY